MGIINRIVGAYLILHGAVTALFTIIEPLYNNIGASGNIGGSGYDEVWNYLDPMTGAGIILGIIFAATGKWAGGRGGDNGDGEARPLFPRLVADVRFYGFLFLALLFFRVYFSTITGNVAYPQAADVQWSIIYALYPLLAGALAVSLWRRDG